MRIEIDEVEVGCSASTSPAEVPTQEKLSRRKRTVSEPQLTSLSPSSAAARPAHQRSLSRDVRYAAAEAYRLTGFAFILLRYLGVGYRWITQVLALACYAMFLLPGFLQGWCFYCKLYLKHICYRLDLFLPTDQNNAKPVLVFVTGGAWIIGNKAWGALLGRRLSERGVIVACIDYRNFPQGTISDMVKDVSQAISFVCNNIASYGGDPNRIYLAGQSAGAHIAACTLVDQAIKECEGDIADWNVSQIKSYFGICGGYNMVNLVDHFHGRGLYRSIFLSIMEGELKRFSPEFVVHDLQFSHAVSLLPRTILFHGTGDYSIPADASKTFADALKHVGVQVELFLYEGKTHTDLFLQDPMRGGRDELLENMISVIHAGDAAALVKDAEALLAPRLVPECMLQLAHKISPF